MFVSEIFEPRSSKLKPMTLRWADSTRTTIGSRPSGCTFSTRDAPLSSWSRSSLRGRRRTIQTSSRERHSTRIAILFSRTRLIGAEFVREGAQESETDAPSDTEDNFDRAPADHLHPRMNTPVSDHDGDVLDLVDVSDNENAPDENVSGDNGEMSSNWSSWNMVQTPAAPAKEMPFMEHFNQFEPQDDMTLAMARPGSDTHGLGWVPHHLPTHR